MDSEQVKERIESALRGKCFVSEFSGGNDHYSVIVVSEQFNRKKLLQRHRMIMDLFKAEIDSGEVHALTIHAYSPDEWHKKKSTIHKEH